MLMVSWFREDLDTGFKGKFLLPSTLAKTESRTLEFVWACRWLYARSVLSVEDANSTEFDPDTRSPYGIFMPEGSKTHMGGTMRLGSRRTYFQVKECESAKLYGNIRYVDERHRHIYEVNPEFVDQIESA